MLTITVPCFAYPSACTLSEIDPPTIKEPTDILVKVHAASINPIDVRKADGKSKFAIAEYFPYPIGYDAAGTVAQIGSGVKHFKVGDAVYTRLPEVSRGSWAEYVAVKEFFVASMPASLSFIEAASIPLAAIISMQTLELFEGGLKGKTVFVPAGRKLRDSVVSMDLADIWVVSGTGLMACQLAKNVYGAGRVITTVSTSKVTKVPELLGQGAVDRVIDYTKTDISKAIPRGSIDFYFDTVGDCMHHLSLMNPKGGHIVSIATLPNAPQMQASGIMRRPGNPQVPLRIKTSLTLLDGMKRLRARRWGAKYEYLMLDPSGDRLRTLGEYVEQGKLRTVVGELAELSDVEGVKRLCQMVFNGKGGTGKMVIQVAEE